MPEGLKTKIEATLRAPSPNDRVTQGEMTPADFDRIEAEQAAKGEHKPPFELTPPDPNSFQGGEAYQGALEAIDEAKTSEALVALVADFSNDHNISNREIFKLEGLVREKIQKVTEARLIADGRSPSVARSLSRASVTGVGGVPKENPHTGQVSQEQAKAIRQGKATLPSVPSEPPKPPTPGATARAQGVIDRYTVATSFEDFRLINEDVLRLDASDPFDPPDHALIEKAAIERHRLLQKKTDVLSQF